MSKERESFNYIKTFIDSMDDDYYSEDVDIVDKGLQRLEQIDNADPSEALETVDFLLSVIKVKDIIEPDFFWKYVKTIKQALIKAQKEHKTLETIKEKCVDVFRINYYITNNRIIELEEYKRDRKLTDEELGLMKEVLE